jgi:hypothetical protein
MAYRYLSKPMNSFSCLFNFINQGVNLNRNFSVICRCMEESRFTNNGDPRCGTSHAAVRRSGRQHRASRRNDLSGNLTDENFKTMQAAIGRYEQKCLLTRRRRSLSQVRMK